MLGSVEYTKSTLFTAPLFQNGAPACIITPSGLSRGALLALFGTLSQDTEPKIVGIWRSALVFQSSRLHNNAFWTRLPFPIIPGSGILWGILGGPGELWGALGSSGELLGSSGDL